MRPESFEELLLEYVDGTLSEDRRHAFEAYLRRHPEERARVRQHEALDGLLGELAQDTDMRLVNGAVARMSDAVCTVLVGLFGLQQNTRPAPRAAFDMADRSILPSSGVTGIDSTRAPR